MTKKVVDFEPAAARRAAKMAERKAAEGATRAAGGEPRRLRAADTWVSAAAEVAITPGLGARAHEPSPEPPAGAEIAETLGQLQRELAGAWRRPAERHLAGLARLASSRTPAEAIEAQAAIANAATAQALADAARIAEAYARLARASARLFAWV